MRAPWQCIIKCLKPHLKRFWAALRGREQKKNDLAEGHAWVNLFAEGLRCAGVPERVIKARLGGVFGLPHLLAVVAGGLIVWGVIGGALHLGQYLTDAGRH